MKYLGLLVLIFAFQALIHCQTTTETSVNNPSTNEAVCKKYTLSTNTTNCGATQAGEACWRCENCSKGSPNGWKKSTELVAAVQRDSNEAKTYAFLCSQGAINGVIYACIIVAFNLFLSL